MIPDIQIAINFNTKTSVVKKYDNFLEEPSRDVWSGLRLDFTENKRLFFSQLGPGIGIYFFEVQEWCADQIESRSRKRKKLPGQKGKWKIKALAGIFRIYLENS